MKQNLRKILAVLILAVSVLGLTACGSTADSEDGITYDAAYLNSVADFLINNWAGMAEADIEEYANMDSEDAQQVIDSYGLPFTAEAFTTAFAGYAGSAEELGAYVSTDSYDDPIVKGDEITLNVNLTYELRAAQLSIVFNEKSVAQSVAVNPEYSIGEILQKAAMNTILGMGTVFCVLIFISLVIYCFNFIPAIQAKFSRKKKEEEAPKPAPVKPAAPAAAPAEENLTDDGELVAAITAAICAYQGTSSDGFVVRSIRRAESANWKRV